MKLHTCEYVCASDLVPDDWKEWFWCTIADKAPFSWGDNNRTLVTASRFADHCDDRISMMGHVPGLTKFLWKVRSLGETYIDLEH